MAGNGVLSLLTTYSVPILLCLVVAHLLSNKLKSGLRDIPGPTLAAYTPLWRLYDVWKGQSQWTAIALHKQHGPLVRIAPNIVSVADPNEVSTIYNIKGDFTKSAFYPIQAITWKKKPQANLFNTRDEAEHRRQRKQVANAYTLESLLKMESAIDGCSKLFLSKMGGYADRGEAVNLGQWLQYYGKLPQTSGRARRVKILTATKPSMWSGS